MDVLAWFEGSLLATAMRQSPWLYPTVKVIHLLGLVLLVGAVTMFDLRLLGFPRQLPIAQAARPLLPRAHVGFGIVARSGALLFIANATELMANPAFLIKMVLIPVAGLNAAAFHLGPYRGVEAWEQNAAAPPQLGLPPSAP